MQPALHVPRTAQHIYDATRAAQDLGATEIADLFSSLSEAAEHLATLPNDAEARVAWNVIYLTITVATPAIRLLAGHDPDQVELFRKIRAIATNTYRHAPSSPAEDHPLPAIANHHQHPGEPT